MKTLRLLTTLAASAGFVLLAGCGNKQASPESVRDSIAATLPEPYFEDLITESISVDGKRLVMQIRSPAGDADKTREAPGFEILKQSEQDEMRALCTWPAIQPLIGGDTILVRRFVDRHDKLFFELEFPARDCPPPPST